MTDNFSIFPKTLPRDQNTEERRTYHSWFTANLWQTCWKKIDELGKSNGFFEKLGAHYG